jgi:hypothetical protein
LASSGNLRCSGIEVSNSMEPVMTTELRDTASAPDRAVMGAARSGWLSRIVHVLTFVGVLGSVVAMAVSYFKG